MINENWRKKRRKKEEKKKKKRSLNMATYISMAIYM